MRSDFPLTRSVTRTSRRWCTRRGRPLNGAPPLAYNSLCVDTLSSFFVETPRGREAGACRFRPLLAHALDLPLTAGAARLPLEVRPHARQRGSWYSRLAISTRSWPSAVCARWPKMSRISIGGRRRPRWSSAAERLPACRGVSSESKITVSTDGGSSGSHKASPAPARRLRPTRKVLRERRGARRPSRRRRRVTSSKRRHPAPPPPPPPPRSPPPWWRPRSPHARLSSPSFPFPTYVPGCGARRRWVTVPTTSSPARPRAARAQPATPHAVLVRLVTLLPAHAHQKHALLRGLPAPHVVAHVRRGLHVRLHLALDELLPGGGVAIAGGAKSACRPPTRDARRATGSRPGRGRAARVARREMRWRRRRRRRRTRRRPLRRRGGRHARLLVDSESAKRGTPS